MTDYQKYKVLDFFFPLLPKKGQQKGKRVPTSASAINFKTFIICITREVSGITEDPILTFPAFYIYFLTQ